MNELTMDQLLITWDVVEKIKDKNSLFEQNILKNYAIQNLCIISLLFAYFISSIDKLPAEKLD